MAYESAGDRMYGLIGRPKAEGPHPLLLYGHPGDQGIGASDLDHLLAGRVIQVAPGFRAESVDWHGTRHQSGGQPSPWDGDVEDALRLLSCAEERAGLSYTDVFALGGSRGAGVSLLAAARRPERFRGVVDIIGPTDFFDPGVTGDLETTTLGTEIPKPGLQGLNQEVLQPYLSGGISLDEARAELIRRSVLYFADRLPPLQIHHGTADTVIPLSQSARLADRLKELGQQVEYFTYPGAGHEAVLGAEQLPRILAFLAL